MQKINMDDIKTTKEKKKIYYGVDFFKLVCALLIVLMHSDCHDLTYHGYRPFIATWLIYWLPNLSVPFFFIASGFFFTKGLQRNADDQWHYLRRYLMRIFKMYVFWTIVTLPIAWKCIEAGHPDYSIPLRLVYIVRMFLFSGSLGIYWFILSLMYVAAMIYFTERKHCDWLFLNIHVDLTRHTSMRHGNTSALRSSATHCRSNGRIGNGNRRIGRMRRTTRRRLL